MSARQLTNIDAEVYLESRRRGLLPLKPRWTGWRLIALFLLSPGRVLRLAAARRRAEARADESVRAFLESKNIS